MLKKSRPTAEGTLKKSILMALHAMGCLAWSNAQRGRTYRTGLGVGSADIIACVRMTAMGSTRVARFVALEVKKPGGKRSDDQIAWCDAVNGAGGYAVFVESVDEAVNAIRAAQSGYVVGLAA